MIYGRLFVGLRVLAIIGLALSASLSLAQNAIESLNVSQQGTSVILKITLKNEPGNPPASFLVAMPSAATARRLARGICAVSVWCRWVSARVLCSI